MNAPYDKQFCDDTREESRRSAEQIVPLIMHLVAPKSVVDVGCGQGTWLSVFKRHGATDVLGIDGDWVDSDRLQVGVNEFRVHSLLEPLETTQRFDLACAWKWPNTCLQRIPN